MKRQSDDPPSVKPESLRPRGSRRREIFSKALETLPVGVVLFDKAEQGLFANKAFTRITGYDLRDAPTAEAWFDKAYPDPTRRALALRRFREDLKSSLADRAFASAIVRRDQSLKHVAFHMASVAPGLFAVTLTDVSEAAADSRTVKALYDISNAISVTRDLSELYAAIHAILHKHVDATNFFIGMVDEAHDRIVFPYFADEMDDYYDIANLDDTDTDTLTLRVIRSGRPLFLRNEELAEKKDQGEIAVVGTDPAVWLGVPLTVGGRTIGAMAVQHYENPRHYDKGDVAFMVAVSEQVAAAIERKKAEEDLSRLNERLESMVAERTAELENKALELSRANVRLTELDRIKSSLLSSVSHELRTPLTSILGFAKLIRKDFLKHFQESADEADSGRGARIVANLDIISRESERLTRLISEFLDLAKIESGHMVWNDQFLDPALAAREAVEAARGLFVRSAAVLRLETPSNLPAVRVDPDKLRQVLLNLLTNAAKFTERGEVVLSAREGDGELVFTVRDTGLGIPPEALERVFDKFFKVERSGAEAAPGTGLGLAICRQIVEHYGGRIQASSQLGRGSVFYFTLPAATS